jgi:oligopeptidase B
VPVTLLHHTNLKLDGKNPVLMRSYGAYGIPTDADLRIENFPLLERGWVIALPHVRYGTFGIEREANAYITRKC